MQQFYNRYKDKKSNKDPNAFDGKFENFLSWYVNLIEDDGKCYCCYCGIDDATASAAFDKNVLSSKKFSGRFHVERLDPKGGYNSENCRLACALCNNAKSDTISEKDFRDYIAPGFIAYWKKIKKELEK